MPVDAVYRAWGLEGYDVIEVGEDQDELLVCVAWPRDQWRCPECRSGNVICHDRRTRLWRSTPVAGPARTLEGIGRTGCGIVPAKKQLETRGQTNSRYQVSLFERQSRGFTLCSGELVWSNFERKTRISPVNQTS